MTKCPSCGYERKDIDKIIDSTQCPQCGIVYSKWQSAGDSNAVRTTQSAGSSGSDPDHTSGVITPQRLIVYLVVGIVAAVLFLSLAVPFVVKQYRAKDIALAVDEEVETEAEETQTSDVDAGLHDSSGQSHSRESSSGRTALSEEASSGNQPDEDSTVHKIIYCYADSSGKLNFVEWRTGMQLTRSDGTVDREGFAKWAMDQVGGDPGEIEPEREARHSLDRQRDSIFKTIFPYKSTSDGLTQLEKDSLEKSYQRHYAEAYKAAVNRRNEAVRKFNYMMQQFADFEKSRQ